MSEVKYGDETYLTVLGNAKSRFYSTPSREALLAAEAECERLREKQRVLSNKNLLLLIVVKSARDKVCPWLSASLEDPNVCTEMKNDVREFFATIHAVRDEL